MFSEISPVGLSHFEECTLKISSRLLLSYEFIRAHVSQFTRSRRIRAIRSCAIPKICNGKVGQSWSVRDTPNLSQRCARLGERSLNPRSCPISSQRWDTRRIVITRSLNKWATIIKFVVPSRAAAWVAVENPSTRRVGNSKDCGNCGELAEKLEPTGSGRGAASAAPLHGCPLFMIRFRVVILVRETRTRWDVLIPQSFQGALSTML